VSSIFSVRCAICTSSLATRSPAAPRWSYMRREIWFQHQQRRRGGRGGCAPLGSSNSSTGLRGAAGAPGHGGESGVGVAADALDRARPI
jgi:hypothetical protein